MKFSFRFAWREARAARGRFIFVIFAIAVGVAALTGVRGFNESVHHTLLAEARTLMGADLAIRLTVDPTADELSFLDRLEQRGIEWTQVTETVSMASSASEPQPLLVSVKAADFRAYPYYGSLEFDPAVGEFSEDEVAVSEDLLLRLDAVVGDSLQVGAGSFRITAVVVREPDRMTAGFTLGPRVLMTRSGYERAGLAAPGSRATQRLLLRLPEGADLGATRAQVEEIFGRRGRVADFTEENRTLSRGINRATTFLSLVSLIALIVGGLGVATTIDSHLRQKMDSIAIIKCIGGKSRQVMRIYLVQAVMLGLAGSAIGVAVGFAAQWVFPYFLAGYFDVDIHLVLSWTPALQGLLAGVLTALLFTLPPLLSIAEIRPALVFRRDVIEPGATRRSWKPFAAFGLIAVGLWAMAVWVGGSLQIGSIFAGGLALSVMLLAMAGKGLMLLVRKGLDRAPRSWHPSIRYGISNLQRPGAHMVAVLVALGAGVMFTLSVQLLETSLIEQLRTSAPPDMPNVYMINITDRERDGLWDLITRHDGVIEANRPSPAVQGLLHRINGQPVEELNLGEGQGRYLRGQFTLTWAEEPPNGAQVLEGAWWAPDVVEKLVSVEENAAGVLGLAVGDAVEWSVGGRIAAARVANIRRTDGTTFGANSQFIFTPPALEGFPGVYYGALLMEAGQIAPLQRAVFERYPSITIINIADILDVVQAMLGRIALTVRFVAGFAMVGGVIILASSIASARYRRIREAAILKTVGATRARIVGVFSVEFLIIGLAAGLIGSALAAVFTTFVVEHLMDGAYVFRWTPILLAVALTAVLAVATGWAASHRVLGQKPLEVLRRADA